MTIGCVILAGGKSSRMGSDKALLQIEGKKFIEIIAEELSFFEEKMIARGNNSALTDLDWTIIPDIYPDHGPIGGIHAALSTCQSDAMFFVSCDMPLIQKSLVISLCQELGDGIDAVISVTNDGRVHPLCGVYRKSVCSLLEKHILEGNNKLMRALDKMRVKYVNLSSVQETKQLLNVNTLKDYNNLKEQLK